MGSSDGTMQALDCVSRCIAPGVETAEQTHSRPQSGASTGDLEVASGVVEGGVKHVIGKRFDNGSMRWIRERAEARLHGEANDKAQQRRPRSEFGEEHSAGLAGKRRPAVDRWNKRDTIPPEGAIFFGELGFLIRHCLNLPRMTHHRGHRAHP